MKTPLITNLAVNQFVIIDENGKTFQSYSTKICFIDNDKNIFLDAEKWDFSRTTLKYLGQFLGLNKKEIEQQIKNGSIKFIDLNN